MWLPSVSPTSYGPYPCRVRQQRNTSSARDRFESRASTSESRPWRHPHNPRSQAQRPKSPHPTVYRLRKHTDENSPLRANMLSLTCSYVRFSLTRNVRERLLTTCHSERRQCGIFLSFAALYNTARALEEAHQPYFQMSATPLVGACTPPMLLVHLETSRSAWMLHKAT